MVEDLELEGWWKRAKVREGKPRPWMNTVNHSFASIWHRDVLWFALSTLPLVPQTFGHWQCDTSWKWDLEEVIRPCKLSLGWRKKAFRKEVSHSILLVSPSASATWGHNSLMRSRQHNSHLMKNLLLPPSQTSKPQSLWRLGFCFLEITQCCVMAAQMYRTVLLVSGVVGSENWRARL